MTRAGCQIAYDFIHGRLENDDMRLCDFKKLLETDENAKFVSSRPLFLDYIADRDLYTNTMPNAVDISMALFVEKLNNLGKFTEVYEGSEELINSLRIRGGAYNQYKNMILKSYEKFAHRKTFIVDDKNYEILMVECIDRSLRSDLGNYLSRLYDDIDGVLLWRNSFEDKMYHCSLRTHRNDIDLLPLAGKYGGGGHMKACGFEFSNQNQSINKILFD